MMKIVGIDLPLPSSYSDVDTRIARKNSDFRRHLESIIGHRIVLTGKMTANPNYKVLDSLSEDEAMKIVNQINKEINKAIEMKKIHIDKNPKGYAWIIDEENKIGESIMKIKLSELKRIIKEEVERAKLLDEQGRPRTEETSSPAFDSDEFIQYLTAGHYKSKRGLGSIRSPRGVKSAGAGRPEKFYVDTPDGVTDLTAMEIIDLYDPKASMAFDVYDVDGAFLAKIPIDWELGERTA